MKTGSRDTSSSNEAVFDKVRLTCSADLVLRFFREMAIMLGAGIPLGKVVDSQAQISSDEVMHFVLDDLHRMISSGRTLSESLRCYPRIFSGVCVAMIELGETTGRLTQSSGQLALWMERDLDVRKRVGAALVYPAFSLVLTLVLTLLLFLFVIPDFLGMLTGMGATVPLPTRILLFLTSFLTSPLGWAVMMLSAVFLYLSGKAILASSSGRRTVTALLFEVPALGPLLRSATLARYCAAAETMSECGTDLFTVARLAAVASGSSLLQNDVTPLSRSLSEGESLSSHMAANPDLYPGTFAQFCSVGEESARMTEMFAFLRTYYDEEVNYRLKAVTSMMEPLIMAVLAFIVGFVVISLLLPLHNFLSTLS